MGLGSDGCCHLRDCRWRELVIAVVNRLKHCGTPYRPCIALSQTKTAQPASQANSEPTVDPKTACPGYRCRLLSYFMRFWLTNKDAVADELSLPFDRISLEMVYQGLYHFSVAYDKGEQTTPLSTLLLRRINT